MRTGFFLTTCALLLSMAACKQRNYGSQTKSVGEVDGSRDITGCWAAEVTDKSDPRAKYLNLDIKEDGQATGYFLDTNLNRIPTAHPTLLVLKEYKGQFLVYSNDSNSQGNGPACAGFEFDGVKTYALTQGENLATACFPSLGSRLYFGRTGCDR